MLPYYMAYFISVDRVLDAHEVGVPTVFKPDHEWCTVANNDISHRITFRRVHSEGLLYEHRQRSLSRLNHWGSVARIRCGNYDRIQLDLGKKSVVVIEPRQTINPTSVRRRICDPSNCRAWVLVDNLSKQASSCASSH